MNGKFFLPILIAIILGAGGIQAQVFWHNKAIANNKVAIEKHIDYDKNDHDAITRIEKDIETIKKTQERLEKKIDTNQEVLLKAINGH